ncbi:MAG: hypothetical protein KME03_05365 [Aphanocapsa lilacina HA4352-LM1]|nr:hypothetical protein [Aphanocapsa lilacina HA4352-LM1]
MALSSAPVAYAQTAAYLGGGLSAGLTGGSGPGEGSSTGGMVTGRYALPVPVRLSLRGDVLFGRKTAFVPTLSIDLPFEGNLLSLGAGASIATAGDDASPLGSRSAFVLRTGFDRFIEDSSLVLVSSFLVGFGAYSDSGTAVAFNVGLAVGF